MSSLKQSADWNKQAEEILKELQMATYYEGDAEKTIRKDPSYRDARDEALTALTQLVESIVPSESHISSKYSTSVIDRMTYDQAFNACRQQVLDSMKGASDE